LEDNELAKALLLGFTCWNCIYRRSTEYEKSSSFYWCNKKLKEINPNDLICVEAKLFKDINNYRAYL
jgi:hypothetical protein